MNHLFFIVTNLAAVYISAALARWTFTGDVRWKVVLAATVNYVLCAYFATLLLGGIGWLRPELLMVTVLVAALLLALLTRISPRPAGKPSRSDISTKQVKDPVTLMAIALVVAFAGSYSINTIFGPTVFSADDLAYHATMVAHWIQDEQLSLAPFHYQAYYPASGEVFALWFMLPYHDSAYASLVGLYWLLLIAFAAACLCKAAGADETFSTICAALVLSSIEIGRQSLNFSAVDLAAAASALAAISMTLSAFQDSNKRDQLASVAYGGLLSGYAVGCKVSFGVLPIFLVVALMWLGKSRVSRKSLFSALAIFLIGAIATGSVWYVRNWIIAGNPLFPGEFGPFDGPFTSSERYRTSLSYWLFSEPRALLNNWSSTLRFFNWGAILLFLSFLGYGAVIFRRQRTSGYRCAMQRVIAIIGILFILLWPLMPFSGSTNAMFGSPVILRRYVLLSFVLGLALVSVAFNSSPKSHAWKALFLVAAAMSWVSIFEVRDPRVVIPAALGVSFVAGFQLWNWRENGISRFFLRPIVGPVIIAAVALSLLAIWQPRKQDLTNLMIYGDATYRENWTPAEVWSLVEAIPDGSTVTAFGPGTYRYYPLFGRGLRLRPLRVEGDGTPYIDIHVRIQDDSVEWLWWPLMGRDTDPRRVLTNNSRAGPADLTHLVQNLSAADVDYVLVSKSFKENWPPQKAVLDSSPDLSLVVTNDQGALYRLVR